MHYNYQLAMAVVNVKYIIKRSRSLFLTIIVSILNFRRKCLKILKYACSKFYKTRIFFYQSFTIFDKKSSRGQKLNFERSIVTILSVLAILAKRLRKRRDIHDPPGSGERGGKRAQTHGEAVSPPQNRSSSYLASRCWSRLVLLRFISRVLCTSVASCIAKKCNNPNK